ncbi:MAG: sulfotransferase family 2 domain-containing protein [Ilumatobacter sp.]|nr:sulfotransferase family 2 domain-containing protein [Ilumatobacter sp.]
MPVYRNHRLVHLHIPKTAGTMLETQFAELGDMDWNAQSFYGRVNRPDRWYEDHHLSLNELRQLSAGNISGLDMFAVVRNPYRRLISEFHWRHRLVVEQNAPELIAFESFDALIAAIPLDLSYNWHRYISLADRDHSNVLIHLRPQWQYVCATSGQPDPTVEIVRFERLRDDLEPLYRRWGVPTRPVHQPSQSRPLGDYYTDKSLAIVNQVYGRDLAWFGYERIDTIST